MVTVRFLNLLRSTYKVEQIEVESGSVRSIIAQIISKVPDMREEDFEQAVLFVNQVKVMHVSRYDDMINDGDVVVFTHFIGGG
ncbi:MAG: hypothetical protein EA375_05580 [Acholeplasmataceae bacterium]|nr:MAG: hypothetical protein EA375_05580 [Acholeplasmataceae bacterium]